MELNDFFSQNGLLAKNFKNFELREFQLEMAQTVQEALTKKRHTLIEAGTGTGKSFAYLIPVILYSIEKNERVIISTSTKSLQQQMVYKDLPFLAKIFQSISLPFNFEIFYGSNNYLCLDKAYNFFSQSLLNFGNIEKLEKWVYNTKSGLKFDIDFTLEQDIWHLLNRDSDICTRKRCKHFNQCFYYKALEKLYKTNIIVVNHHLFFANIASGSKILPPFTSLVLDEAHDIEDIATQFFAETVSEYEMHYLFNIIDSLSEYLTEMNMNINIIAEYKKQVRQATSEIEKFFSSMKKEFKDKTRITEKNNFDIEITYFLNQFIEQIDKSFQNKEALTEEAIDSIELIKNKLIKTNDTLKSWLLHSKTDEYVYWIEFYGKKRFCNLKFTPFDMSPLLKEQLFSFYDSAILTSATLTTNKNFDFIKSRIGIENPIEKIYPSPFDYKKQVLLYTNEKIPSPKNYNEYLKVLTDYIPDIIEATDGRAFILFTSYKTLMDVRDAIEEKIPYRLLVQNELPFNKIIEEFRNDINSVLMGTISFWQGVDIQGEALSAVIITRLPFDVPDDPIVEARIEKINSNNGRAFIEYQVPNAAMLLKQGFGRLIRHKEDKGVVAILDSRIVTSSYGSYFLNSLPECSRTSRIDDIINFFNNNS